MRVKVSGTWQDVNPMVKLSGTWTQVKRVWVKKAGTWQLNWGFTFNYTFPANNTYTDYTLTSISGYDATHDVNITIPSTVVFKASATNTYALSTGAYGGTGTLKIINNGKIIGKGGNGGNGGDGNSNGPGANGAAGGPGFYADAACTIDNNGTIAGGGGGGGGGGGHRDSDSSSGDERADGGGGGGGASYGTGGTVGPYYATAGGTATLTSPGGGGSGGVEFEDSKFSSGDARGGNGGSGGAPGNGGDGGGSGGGAGGSGGAAGTNYSGSTITWI
jgi:hypothetical protein